MRVKASRQRQKQRAESRRRPFVAKMPLPVPRELLSAGIELGPELEQERQRQLEALKAQLTRLIAEGKQAEALAGATPYQRLFGLVLTGAYLAKGALADGGDGRNGERAALCRFAAENVIGETVALKDRVMSGAASLAAARAVLG